MANKNKRTTKTVRVNLKPGDSDIITKVADNFQVTEAEVLRKGLQLMQIYSKVRQENSTLVIEDKQKETRTEIIII